MMQKVPVKILREGAALPTYGTASSAGADLRACLDAPVVLAPGETRLIPIGIAMEIPEGYVGLVFARSGLASRRDLAPANKVGVVDSDYRGEFFVPMRNHGAQPQTIEPGERIAQFILTPYLTAQFFETETLTDTARGEGGFGSTGAKYWRAFFRSTRARCAPSAGTGRTLSMSSATPMSTTRRSAMPSSAACSSVRATVWPCCRSRTGAIRRLCWSLASRASASL